MEDWNDLQTGDRLTKIYSVLLSLEKKVTALELSQESRLKEISEDVSGIVRFLARMDMLSP